MVNKKPSTGCGRCRERRVKCDEAKPACRRCESRGIACPGYRDVGGLIFLNASTKVTERHKKRTTPSTQSPTSTQQLTPLSTPSPVHLADSVESFATTFLFNHYLTGKTMTRKGHLDFLMPMYQAATPESPLALATMAMAFQVMSMCTDDQDHRRMHAEYEWKACQGLQSAVANAELSVKDETLMAVLCLDHTEHISARNASRTAGRAHMDGALALVRHRPESSFASEAARWMFASTRSNVLLQSLWYGDAHSQFGVQTMPKINIGPLDPQHDLHHILLRSLAFEQTLMKASVEERITHQQEWSTLAMHLYHDLYNWYMQGPMNWLFVYARPLVKRTYSGTTIHDACMLGQWHCLKVLMLKLVFATSTEPDLLQGIPDEVELNLQHMLLVVEFLQHVSDVLAVTSPKFEAIIDRGFGAVVASRKGGPGVVVGKLTQVEHNRLNLLRWIMNELLEDTPPGAERFFYMSKSLLQE